MPQAKWIVAHRGEHGDSPRDPRENTLPAFEQAIKRGADMVEFDVRRLADGTLVVFHDDSIGGGILRDARFRDVRDAGSAAGIDIPTLAQVLELCSGRIQAVIELKDEHCEQDLVDALFAARFRLADYLVISFDPLILQALTDLRPGIRTGLLVERAPVEEALEQMRRAGADYLGPDFEVLDDATLAKYAAAGVPLLPWTVNRREDIVRLLRAEAVAGVITDRLHLALGLRRMVAQERP